MDTIFALASARGRAGVAVVRISGPEARAAAENLAGALPWPGRSLRKLRSGGDVLDEALVLTFAAGGSFTGEEVAELHLHGSPAVVSAVLRVLGTLPGLRAATAGEFTQRAFLAGRLDLAQVEALADLIDAETERQRVQAMRALAGALGKRAEDWRRDLVRAAALIEATIDFADEDVPEDVSPEVATLLGTVLRDLRRESAGVAAAERVRDGFEVAILGAPNVGKSTLLNALAGREAAITSEVAGTTRDVIEVQMELSGLPVTLLDTAGLREGGDQVERIGMERARARAALADLRVHLVEPGGVPAEELREGDLVVTGKADRGGAPGLAVSGLTGEGLDALIAEIVARLEPLAQGSGVASRARHRAAMDRAADALDDVIEGLDRMGQTPDLLAHRLREAILALDELVGRVDVEQVLDEVFASFCIGK
ncbi:tRNA uridine-5-carboxymethylaminomethyl(34) synthesis GTPase MnmE [Histidinibacterium lentulum]|uniref:tRNA modification GTPase MnmE n=1 Tax=Histidinibacterium lentulum TaxID=2480588 RepID=A0A3N2R6Q0_9RHOB|nr:tRNA uridine-5-carboxymethylaminomethyl(34) synthesis GTPase MnmE [Histidinibacterium lentulum]ROU03159.1 tRNA uridine-5-carboxymethylaminomethyl(34) synthesis GTPase MnmE [Histidinibacterium lentulum]